MKTQQWGGSAAKVGLWNLMRRFFAEWGSSVGTAQRFKEWFAKSSKLKLAWEIYAVDI